MTAPGHAAAPPSGLVLGRVTDTQDPQRRGRVRLSLVPLEVELWANVAMPSAGRGYGAALLPKVGEVVVVGFLGAETPVVLGALWSGDDSQPDRAAPVEDRYLIRTPSGTLMLMDDADGPSLLVETPGGVSLKLSDSGGGEITGTVAGNTVKVTTSTITLTATSEVKVEAPKVTVSAPLVTLDAAMTKASGVVKCDTLIATSVVGTSYTPGAGNIW
ncbi:phage baseplate assembly protein V [Paracraurococcus ruber]|uniref:VgrG protein n=1 Tax=Paracraurococcus ruber TaxID=77675 RepID=A0ABS1CTE8_9PROT|nr:phage baseplate assembly protein V [Paracraurococcus ruber]MBK1657109.1 VgrG protein [Paracraurococcus ruber]TDG33407.1 VgrG protein [Paracraurococcus ruber]